MKRRDFIKTAALATTAIAVPSLRAETVEGTPSVKSYREIGQTGLKMSDISFGTGKLSDTKLTELIREHFDLRPYGIIRMLDLIRPIYKQTAAYGHFGREEKSFTWERLDLVKTLQRAIR